MAWDDTKKAEVIERYEAAKPTPETSLEIVKELAEEYEESPNGVRMILTKAGIYIKKGPASSSGSDSETKPKTTRVSKAGAQEALKEALRDAGAEVDEDIISKLTGKAAQYFAKIIAGAPDESEED